MRIPKIALSAGALCTVFAAIWFVVGREPDLLSVSRRIEGTEAWAGEIGWANRVCWLSDRRVLSVHVVPPNYVPSHVPDEYFQFVETSARAERPDHLPPRRSNGNDISAPFSASPSPDGRWLLLEGWSNRRLFLGAYSLVGSRTVRWRAAPFESAMTITSPRWFPDGRRWMRLIGTQLPSGKMAISAVIRDITHPEDLGKLPLSGIAGQFVALTPAGTGLVCDTPENRPGLLTVTEFTFEVPARIVARTEVDTRVVGDMMGAALSPDGRRIAFVTALMPELPGPSWLHWFFRYLHAEEHGTARLYVCRRDGRHVRMIGSVTTKTPYPYDSTPMNPCWSPDGSRVGFHYKRAFWTVDVKD